MPLIESQPDALARIYAQSLFDLANAEGGQAKAEEVLDELEAVLDLARSDPRFTEFLSSRIVPADARAKAISRIFSGRVSDLTRRFLLVLNDKGRLGNLPSFTAALDELVQRAFGRVEVDVYTAEPLSAEQIDGARTQLRALLGKEPVIHPYTDRSMIGGIKLQIGDRLLDASLLTQLRRLKDRFNTDGAAAIKARMGRIIDGASGNGHP